jgi:acetyl-CoA carboxylase alpha subunit
MSRLRTPIVTVITGEGGSGGALAIAVGDVVLALENAVYSVISPEGCAAILWKDASQKERAAQALRLTAPDLLQLGVIDTIVTEPGGGAHADPAGAAGFLSQALTDAVAEVTALPTDRLLAERAEKFLRMGHFSEA